MTTAKNTDYEAARIDHNKAIKTYEHFRDAYRNLEIGDDEFLSARADYDKATAEFDVAYAKAADADDVKILAVEPKEYCYNGRLI